MTYLQKHERHFLHSKVQGAPALPALPEARLAALIGDLATAERKALAEICCQSHVFIVDGQALLLMEVSDKTLDTLAAFAVDEEDLEDDLCDEPQSDDEPSLAGFDGGDYYHGDREEDCNDEDDGRAPKGAKKSREAMCRKLRRVRKKNGGELPFRDIPANFDLAGMTRRQGRGWF